QEEEKKKQEEEEARRKKEEEEKQKQLTLNPTSITLTSLQTKNVEIKNGTAPYEAKVANDEIARVRVDNKDNYIAVTGLREGTTEIVVTDKNMKTGKVTVTTRNPQPITVSKANVTLSVGKSERVNIQSGRYPYKAVAADKSVVEVSVTDATITIKALKEGRTDVTVTDKVGAKGRIAVTVSK
ncbi:bacterial group 2 Ig-like protein, partial [Prevotella sp. DNF00663]